MAKKIQIDNKELLILLEFHDSEYEKIIMCLDKQDNKVFVINNKVVTDKKMIKEINKKYNLELTEEFKGNIF